MIMNFREASATVICNDKKQGPQFPLHVFFSYCKYNSESLKLVKMVSRRL